MQRNPNLAARLRALYYPNDGDRKNLNWINEDINNFFRVRDAHAPAVNRASRALQNAAGISPGMKILGGGVVMPWRLPEPPEQTLKQMFEALGRRLDQVGERESRANRSKGGEGGVEDGEETVSEEDGEESSEESEGPDELLWNPMGGEGDDGEECDVGLLCEKELSTSASPDEIEDAGKTASDVLLPTDSEDNKASGKDDIESRPQPKNGVPPSSHGAESRPLKRKAEDSPPAQNPHDIRDAKKPKIIIDLTEGTPNHPPLASNVNPSHLALPQVASNLPPASPPPDWIPLARGGHIPHIPTYWTHTLSQHLNRWLDEHGTESSQTLLSHLELRGFSPGAVRGGEDVYFTADANAKNCARIKMSQLTLPMDAVLAAAGGASGVDHETGELLLDWIVLQIDHKYPVRANENDNKEVIIPLPSGAVPYSLIAFPRQAITNSSSVYHRIPAPTLPPRPQGRKPKTKEKEKGVWITTMVLGQAGRVPLVHGRGVKARFASRFVDACAGGEGVVEVWSETPVLGDLVDGAV